MRKVLLFAKREYKAAVKTKGFIIGLVLAPIIMSGGAIALVLLKDRIDTTDKYAAIVDHSKVMASALIQAADERNSKDIFEEGTSKKIKPAYYFEIVEPDTINPDKQYLKLSDKVRQGELHAFIVIGKNVAHPNDEEESSGIKYYGKNAAMDDFRRWITWPANDHLRQIRLSDAGIDQSQVKDLFNWIDVEGLGLVSVDVETGNIGKALTASPIEALIVPIVLMFLMFLMVMMSVPGMLNSVMEEKTQRISEVVLGSITPFQFMLSKLISGIAISLTSASVYIFGGLFVLNTMGFERFIPMHALPWFFIYMLLAIIMFGSFSAALGSTCSEPKDAQSLTFPSILPALIPIMVYFPIAKEPMSSFATWMSLFPPFTPFLMLLRIATPEGVPAWQPYVGLLGVLLFTWFFVWVGARIFRVAILIQGMPPTLANMVRWAFRG
jgi:ABC-2 type transport system permease protein